MAEYATNQERTAEYLEKFDREKTLKILINNDSPTIVDVGANFGDTLVEFKQWWPASTVHCFEPQQECWELLESKKAKYPDDSVLLEKRAVGNKSGEKLAFYTHDISKGISGFNKVNMSSHDSIQINNIGDDTEALDEYVSQFNHEREVVTTRLDDYFTERGVKQVDLMKIDTQGFEPEVLEGCGEQLKNVGVVLTELMFYDYYDRSLSFSDIEKYLIPAGFSLYDINHIAKNPMNGRTDWIDVIYVNRNVLEKTQ